MDKAGRLRTRPEHINWEKLYLELCYEVTQVLGKALGYPLEGPEVGGDYTTVCVGDHVPESILAEAANRIRSLQSSSSKCSNRSVFNTRKKNSSIRS